MTDAFKHQDKAKVPLLWQHDRTDPSNVMGHAILENRPEGVYAYAYLNQGSRAQQARFAIEHEDVDSFSIHARQLKERDGNVFHGNIKEVSIVLNGANPGAIIDNVFMQHGDDKIINPDEVIIYPDEAIEHEDLPEGWAEELFHAEDDKEEFGADETLEDIYESMTPKQQRAVDIIVSQLAGKEGEEAGGEGNDSAEHSDEGTEDKAEDNSTEGSESDNTDSSNENIQHQEGTEVTHNAFETAAENGTLTHSGRRTGVATLERKKPHLSHDELQGIIEKAKNYGGSYKKAFINDHLEHADYGIEDIDFFFPDFKNLDNQPQLLARQTAWVTDVLAATKHSPMSRIKTLLADLTGPEARARGYVKGNEKTDEVISLLKRQTGPTTIYKKQKLDRDDIIDIVDFDVVAWLKWEIRFMLNEEIARAILIGDGRASNSPDKIKDPAGSIDGVGIRSILKDNDLYSIKHQMAANTAPGDAIDEITRSRVGYRGAGSPTLYTTDEFLTELLLEKDGFGRRLYNTEAELASALRVKEIVSVEVFNDEPTLVGIIVNLTDYTIGANKGGEISFFEDFDIDFNQEKYLMETRISGALTKPKSAIVITRETGTEIDGTELTAPSFDGATDTITIPTTTGIDYVIDGETVAAGPVVITEDTTVTAEAKDGYYIKPLTTKSWTFTV
jgi:HK97 family phage major capsid protein